jgi:hypothetical protein
MNIKPTTFFSSIHFMYTLLNFRTLIMMIMIMMIMIIIRRMATTKPAALTAEAKIISS